VDWCNVFGGSDIEQFQLEEFKLLLRSQDELARLGVPANGTDPFGKHARRF